MTSPPLANLFHRVIVAGLLLAAGPIGAADPPPLRDYHAERGETLATTWLNQVMEPPAKPVDKYLLELLLTPVEEPGDKKN
jgi:hypothetical protein